MRKSTTAKKALKNSPARPPARRTTELHRLPTVEEALRRSEANLAKAQQIAHLGSYEVEIPFSKADYRSDEIFRIIGLQPRQQQLSTNEYIRRFVHPADRSNYRDVLKKSIENSIPFNFEYRVVRPDGTVRYVQSVGEPVANEQGKIVKLVGTLLDITERKQLESALLEISDREQRRIGQDLHDGLGQHLAGIELMSQVLEQNLATKNLPAEAARAGALAKHVRDAISQARSLARGLAPVVLESEGLMSALQELAESTERVFGVRCRFQCDKPVPIHDPKAANHLYRIAQEAVSNAMKHGRAKTTVIALESVQRRVRMTIRDDGKGLPKVIPRHKGMGLRIMQYRASMINGTLTVAPDAHGTVVTCSIPVPHH